MALLVSGHNEIAALCRVILLARGLDASRYAKTIYYFAAGYNGGMDAEEVARAFLSVLDEREAQ